MADVEEYVVFKIICEQDSLLSVLYSYQSYGQPFRILPRPLDGRHGGNSMSSDLQGNKSLGQVCSRAMAESRTSPELEVDG